MIVILFRVVVIGDRAFGIPQTGKAGEIFGPSGSGRIPTHVKTIDERVCLKLAFNAAKKKAWFGALRCPGLRFCMILISLWCCEVSYGV